MTFVASAPAPLSATPKEPPNAAAIEAAIDSASIVAASCASRRTEPPAPTTCRALPTRPMRYVVVVDEAATRHRLPAVSAVIVSVPVSDVSLAARRVRSVSSSAASAVASAVASLAVVVLTSASAVAASSSSAAVMPVTSRRVPVSTSAPVM